MPKRDSRYYFNETRTRNTHITVERIVAEYRRYCEAGPRLAAYESRRKTGRRTPALLAEPDLDRPLFSPALRNSLYCEPLAGELESLRNTSYKQDQG